ncbi:MAG: C25 family cysteine peptidase [Bacteroidota bacterium]
MKKNIFAAAKSLLILSIIFYSGNISAEQFEVNQGSETEFKVIQNTCTKFSFTNTVSSIQHFSVATEKGSFQKLIIPGYVGKAKIGNSELPHLCKLIEIPQNANIKVIVNNYDVEEFPLSDLGIINKIFPHQPSISKSQAPSTIEFKYNPAAYQIDDYDQVPLVSYKILGQMRGTRIARIDIAPVKYNPVQNKIKVYTNIEVEIHFPGADIAQTELIKKKTYSPYFEPLYKKLTNYKPIASKDTISKYPIKYVIVSDPMFQGVLQPFIEWKTKKGFYIIEAYTNDPGVGSTNTSIAAYLENLYNQATPSDPAPSFVLFVGDIDQVPAFAGNTDSHVTDLYFCEYTGDYFPEVYYGRFSANNIGELQPQIDKTLEYEQYLMPDPSFLDDILMVSGVDGSMASVWGNGQINYGNQYYFNSAHGITSHTYLYPASAYAAADIIQYVSDGVGFVNYTAHGNYDGWSDPSFNLSDINGLQNQNKYPLMIGNACLTNKFDESVCFGEALLRADNKGAIGYIGGSNSTLWDEDYWWGVGNGVIDSLPIYAQTGLGAYDRTFHDNGEPQGEWYAAQDQMIFAGNLAVTEAGSGYFDYYWEIYHLMGDPSLMIYFSVPDTLSVSHSPAIPIGLTTFTVITEPYTYVALSMDSVLYGAALADAGGVAEIIFSGFFYPGTATVVATKQNRQPYIGSVTVYPPSGPYVILSSHLVRDTTGNNNGNADYSENITLDITLENVGDTTAINVSAILSSNDNYITITDSAATFGDIDTTNLLTISDAFAFTVNDSVPDQHIVLFGLEIKDINDSTWYSAFNVTLNAPSLGLTFASINDSSGNSNGRLDSGETVIINVNSLNNGYAVSPYSICSLTSSSSYLTINTSLDSVGPLNISSSTIASFNITVDQSTPIGTLVDLNFTLSAGLYSAELTVNKKVGLIVEDWETNDFLSYDWTSGGDVPWIINSGNPYEGNFSARSGVIDDDQSSELIITLEILSDDTISFYKKVSCEDSYYDDWDYLEFLIDGISQGVWDGEIDWSLEKFPVTAGQHTFKWLYIKDGYVSEGQDCAWIDYILFPAHTMCTLTATITASSDVSCNGGNDGSATLTASGGTAPYSYLWSNGGTGATENSLAAGTNDVAVADAGGCSATASITINEPTAISAITTANDASQGNCDGSASLTASGGNPPYTYLWDDTGGQTTTTADNLCAGTYHVTVTDANGCTASDSVTVNEVSGIDKFQVSSSGLEVYPNPNKGLFILETGDIKTEATGEVKVYSIYGELVYNEQVIERKMMMDLSYLPDGIFFVQFIGKEGVVNEKVVLQR